MLTQARWLLIGIFCLWQSLGSAQTRFEMVKGGVNKVDIPFEFVNHFIIVDLLLNGVFPYKFIFDTGAEHTILTRNHFMYSPGMTFERTFYLVGSDQDRVIPAHLVRGVRMDIPGKATAKQHDVLMLEENLFAFEEFTGVKVDGILSASVFEDFIFRINFQKRIITLFNKKGYENAPKHKSAQAVPLEVIRHKPYLQAQIQITPNQPAIPVKLLADTGAAMAMVLFTDSTIVPPVHAIPGKFAMGIGGDLEGYIGRVHNLQFGEFSQKKVLNYYQHIDSLEFKTYLNNRNGLIGNQVWSHFIVDFDYTEQKLWLQPSGQYDAPYHADRSGLSVLVGGKHLNQFFVYLVQPESAGAEAGIVSGDRILRINHIPCNLISIDTAQKMLRAKRKKPVSIVVKRNGKKMRFRVQLRDVV